MSNNFCYLNRIVSFTVIVLLMIKSCDGRLPNDIHKCRIDDADCISNQAQTILVKYYEGNEQMGLLSLDPLKIDSMKLTETNDEKKSVNINLFFKNLKVYGISKGKIDHLKISNHSNNRNIEIELKGTFPHLELIGDYTVNGKILLLPITGTGKCNITAENMILKVNLQGSFMQHNGKDYLFIKRIASADAEISHAYIDLRNLFNGNKLLGDGMNKFLNENWSELWKELRPAFIETFGHVGLDVANTVFQRNTYKKLFLT